MNTMTKQRRTGWPIAADDALARFFLERLSELTARQDAAANTPEPVCGHRRWVVQSRYSQLPFDECLARQARHSGTHL